MRAVARAKVTENALLRAEPDAEREPRDGHARGAAARKNSTSRTRN